MNVLGTLNIDGSQTGSNTIGIFVIVVAVIGILLTLFLVWYKHKEK